MQYSLIYQIFRPFLQSLQDILAPGISSKLSSSSRMPYSYHHMSRNGLRISVARLNQFTNEEPTSSKIEAHALSLNYDNIFIINLNTLITVCIASCLSIHMTLKIPIKSTLERQLFMDWVPFEIEAFGTVTRVVYVSLLNNSSGRHSVLYGWDKLQLSIGLRYDTDTRLSVLLIRNVWEILFTFTSLLVSRRTLLTFTVTYFFRGVSPPWNWNLSCWTGLTAVWNGITKCSLKVFPASCHSGSGFLGSWERMPTLWSEGISRVL